MRNTYPNALIIVLTSFMIRYNNKIAQKHRPRTLYRNRKNNKTNTPHHLAFTHKQLTMNTMTTTQLIKNGVYYFE